MICSTMASLVSMLRNLMVEMVDKWDMRSVLNLAELS